MLPPVFQWLKASTNVKNIVGTNPPRIWRGIAPQTADGKPMPNPYITWFAPGIAPENNLSDPPPTDRVTVQVDCWHQTDEGIVLLATAARDAIELHCHVTNGSFDPTEPETKLRRFRMTFDAWVDRGRTVPD